MLPTFKDENKNLMLLQSSWGSQLNPILSNPTTNPSRLKSITLTTGDNVINHKLGVTLQGWYISDINGAAVVYRNAPLNNLTLTLNSNAAVIVDIVVF